MSASLRATHREVIRAAPPGLRERLDWLPRELGVSESRGGWGDYARLPPVVGLPRFIALPKEKAASVLKCHILGGFWGLARDRAADAQASADCAEEIGYLERRWLAALSTSIGAGPAERTLAQATARLEEGLALERALIDSGRTSFAEYARCLWLRTAWFPASTLMAATEIAGLELPPFELGLQELMLSLQLLDDAVDEAEDKRTRGFVWSSLLGLDASAMMYLSAWFAQRAAETLTNVGLSRLSRWCHRRATQMWRLSPPAQRLLGPMLLVALDVPTLRPPALWTKA